MSSEKPRADEARHAAERIHEEHRQLKALLERVSAARDLPALAPLLAELRPLLASHFAHEEGVEGLRDAVTGEKPHLDERVDAILAEHRKFLDDLAELLARARELQEVSIPNLLIDVADLTRRLHDHEVRETELLTDALYTDLGDKD